MGERMFNVNEWFCYTDQMSHVKWNSAFEQVRNALIQIIMCKSTIQAFTLNSYIQ